MRQLGFLLLLFSSPPAMGEANLEEIETVLMQDKKLIRKIIFEALFQQIAEKSLLLKELTGDKSMEGIAYTSMRSKNVRTEDFVSKNVRRENFVSKNVRTEDFVSKDEKEKKMESNSGTDDKPGREVKQIWTWSKPGANNENGEERVEKSTDFVKDEKQSGEEKELLEMQRGETFFKLPWLGGRGVRIM